MEMKTTQLIVKLYGSSTDGEVREFKVFAPEFADAEFHIDDYKSMFQNHLQCGVYSENPYATFEWVKDSQNFICDSWNR